MPLLTRQQKNKPRIPSTAGDKRKQPPPNASTKIKKKPIQLTATEDRPRHRTKKSYRIAPYNSQQIANRAKKLGRYADTMCIPDLPAELEGDVQVTVAGCTYREGLYGTYISSVTGFTEQGKPVRYSISLPPEQFLLNAGGKNVQIKHSTLRKRLNGVIIGDEVRMRPREGKKTYDVVGVITAGCDKESDYKEINASTHPEGLFVMATGKVHHSGMMLACAVGGEPQLYAVKIRTGSNPTPGSFMTIKEDEVELRIRPDDAIVANSESTIGDMDIGDLALDDK